MQEKENLRWMYNYGLTRNMLRVILHHKDTLSKHLNSREPPLDLNWKKISSAKALNELDLEFTMYVLSFFIYIFFKILLKIPHL